MQKQRLLLPALVFVGSIAVSTVAQNIMDPAAAKLFDNAALRDGHQNCALCKCAPTCAGEPYAVASPQWYENGHFDPAKRTKELSKQLKLTADQQSQMLDTLESTKSQLEAVRSDRSLSRKVRNCKLSLIRQESNIRIRAFLEKKQCVRLARIQSRTYNFDPSPAMFR